MGKKTQQTKAAIAHSSAVNKQRLAKMNKQHQVLSKVNDEARKSLEAELNNPSEKKKFLTALIVQGALMLLEDDAKIRCLPSDEECVKEVIEAAQKEYTNQISQQTDGKVKKPISLSLSDIKLKDGLLGGVVLECNDGNITIDNTIDARLRHVMDEAKPKIRQTLFTTK